MEEKTYTRKKLTVDQIRQIAEGFTSRVTFKRAHPSLYYLCCKYKFLDLVLINLPKPKVWSKESILKEIKDLNITSVSQWKEVSVSSHTTARRMGIYKEIIKGMTKKKSANLEFQVTPDHRQCKVCKLTKPNNEYYTADNGLPGFNSCKICTNEKRRNSRKNQPERFRKHDSVRYKKHRLVRNFLTRYRSILTDYIKNKKSSFTQSVKEFIGCDIDFLKKHLENQFKPGMTWDNYGLYGWHIDHIRPLSSFNFYKEDGTLNKEVCRIAFGYENLQPLWAEENLKKSNKMIPLGGT